MNEEEKKILAEEEVLSGEQSENGQTPINADTAELIRLQEENAQLFTRLQRLQADFDNYRKRVKADKQEWTTQAVCDIVRELLPVIDNLERALEAGGSAELLLTGVDLVTKQFLSVLNKHGLSTIDACGVQFDPTCHHAIMQLECAEPENMVVEELQKGYRLNQRLLRPSMVKVAK
ncbi:MAG: nucleotide exchange factor GrpE [Dethiobacter sp.]|jgi:molecular chaperone GrpE|nr:nucleotide exchange factor GrpE [Dethiobacter sp.]MBS3901790.1 nucleotide exchange factor GrpE [Dethiobacter sp.]MBS3989589.1 nucleotide exchange factor GrpE [Dethiobacter sp.]